MQTACRHVGGHEHRRLSGGETAEHGLARVLRLETMEEVRKVCDAAEALCPDSIWPIASYKQLLFLDSEQGNTIA